MNDIENIYSKLWQLYGPQGWWPAPDYHPGDYNFPGTENQKFEICVGAILTQNTSWKNVEKAILNLKKYDLLAPEMLLTIEHKHLAQVIKSAGYFNQKARKLAVFSEYFLFLNGKSANRQELLQLWGVGPETADSILLYAFSQPTFVVDSYTKRLLTHLGLIKGAERYDHIKALFESCLPKDVILYQEYHALIVAHAKLHYSKKPYALNCLINKNWNTKRTD